MVRLSDGLSLRTALRPVTRLASVSLLLTLFAAAASAQGQVASPKPDFLFGEPHGWVAVRGTWLMPRAGGDLFGFLSDQLTIERTDFRTPAVVGQIGFAVSRQFSVTADLEVSEQRHGTEYRHFIDNFGQPINQSTSLSQTNVVIGLRYSLVDPGRSISRLAYVPRTFIPYVGAGVGMYHYELLQTGDFVDARTLNVFPDVFRSAEWTPSAQLLAGSDIRVWRVIFFDVEARYVFANGDLDSDFVGFNGIDLSGFRFSSGFHVAF